MEGLRRAGVIIAAMLLIGNTLSSQGVVEYPYSKDLTSEPDWVRLMYAESPDAGAVVSAYENYYLTNTFTKNAHTQYYKRWLRGISRAQATNGRSPSDARYLRARQAEISKTRTDENEWISLGPWDWDHEAVDRSYAPGAAHVYTIEQSQSNPDVLYAGTATAGIWKSEDRGLNWTFASHELLINGLTAIEINHSDPEVVYAEILSSVYKTVDGGSSWEPTGDEAFQDLTLNVTDIVMDPVDSSVVWACTNGGLYHTTNSGSTWSQIVTGEILELEFHPENRDTIYMVLKNGDVTEFYRSLNAGSTFTHQTSGWPAPVPNDTVHQRRTEIAVSAADPDLVVALATGQANGGSGLYGIYKSHDAGATWTFECCGPQPAGPPSESNMNLMGWSDQGLDNGGQYYYDLALDVSPTNADSIFVAGVNMWISDDGGSSFVCPAKWSHPYKPGYVHADVHDIRYYASTNELWVSGDGGIFYSDDNGLSFTRRMTGISGTDFWGFGAGSRDADVMLGGTYHNGTLLKDNDTYINGWICTDGGDNYRGFVHPVIDRQAFSDYNIKDLSGDRLVNNATRSFQNKPNASYTIGRSSDILFHPEYYNTWYTGSENILWKTEDNGYTFEEVHDFGVPLAAMDICFTDPDVIYVTTFPGWWTTKTIWRTNDGGDTWTEVTPPSSQLEGNLWVPYAISVDALNPDNVWIARTSMYGGTNFNGAVIFRSQDGGSSWTNYTDDFPTSEACTSIAHHKGSDGGIYIGTRRAVYYRSDTMSGWELYSAGLPATTVSTRLILDYEGQTIRNGTNRSAWERGLYENASPIAQASVRGSSIQCLEDTVYFKDNSLLSSDNASWNWTFEGGTPSSSTERDPKVVYNYPGTYDVTLTVEDDHGTSSRTFNSMIDATDECGVDGFPGKALYTFNAPDYAIVPDMDEVVDSFTIAAWIKPEGIQNDYAAVVMNDGTAGGLNFREGNNTLGYHWPGGQWFWDSGLIAPSGVWSFVAMVVTPTQVKLYLNGVESVHTINTEPLELTTMRIGSYKGWTARNYRGLIDEVSLFERALTIDEIRDMRHLTRLPSLETGLMAYYQFNENGSVIFDKSGDHDASVNGNASKVRSRAPIGSGVSQGMDISAIGTYSFDQVGVQLTFGPGSVTPGGPLWISRIAPEADTMPVGPLLQDGYWIMNNYGVNLKINDPIDVVFDSIGFVSDSMAVSTQGSVYARAENQEIQQWTPLGMSIDLDPGYDGSLTLSGFSGYSPGQLVFLRDSFPFGSAYVSLRAPGDQTIVRGGGSVALDVANDGNLGIRLPILNDNTMGQVKSPAVGMLAYNSERNTVCFFDGADWRAVFKEQLETVPSGDIASPARLTIDDSPASGTIMSLGQEGLLMPGVLADSVFVALSYPAGGALAMHEQDGEIVVYNGTRWCALAGDTTGIVVNLEAPTAQVPGLAVGSEQKEAYAALQVNLSDRALTVTSSRVGEVPSPVEGTLIFDDELRALCFFDGEYWQRIKHQ